jgi:hypothetical protein
MEKKDKDLIIYKDQLSKMEKEYQARRVISFINVINEQINHDINLIIENKNIFENIKLITKAGDRTVKLEKILNDIFYPYQKTNARIYAIDNILYFNHRASISSLEDEKNTFVKHQNNKIALFRLKEDGTFCYSFLENYNKLPFFNYNDQQEIREKEKELEEQILILKNNLMKVQRQKIDYFK